MGAALWFGGPVLLRQVGFFKVRRVELVGVTAATPAEIVAAMRIPPRGNLFDDLDPYAARVLALPGHPDRGRCTAGSRARWW